MRTKPIALAWTLAILVGAGVAVPAGATPAASCPPSLTAVEALLRGKRNHVVQAESPGDEYGETDYDVAGLSILGVRPLSLHALIGDGRVQGLTYRLPGDDPNAYSAAFQAEYPPAQTTCRNGCNWWRRGDGSPAN